MLRLVIVGLEGHISAGQIIWYGLIGSEKIQPEVVGS